MRYLNKVKLIKSHYNIHGNKRIWGLDDSKCEFKMLLGDCIITLPYPKKISRDIKIGKILK